MVKVIVPEGAENVEIKIGGKPFENVKIGRSEGYLDFNGRPTYTISNYQGELQNKDIEVSYTFASNRVFQKPIILTLIVLGFLLFAVFLKRFKL